MGRSKVVDNPKVTAAGNINLSASGRFTFPWTTFSDGDATPSVATGYGFKTANTGATTITDFDDPDSDGQEIVIIFGDTNTIIAHDATKINLQGSGGVDGAFGPSAVGDVMRFLYDGSVWWEDNRSLNS